MQAWRAKQQNTKGFISKSTRVFASARVRPIQSQELSKYTKKEKRERLYKQKKRAGLGKDLSRLNTQRTLLASSEGILNLGPIEREAFLHCERKISTITVVSVQ